MARLRREVAAVDPNAGAMDIMPLREWTDVTLLPQKVTASLAAVLGLISLVLAAIGLYSVMAYAVTQRTREIGIRMALGARPWNVLGDVLWRGLAMTATGLVLGLAAAFVAMRFVAAMLVGVTPTDPASFASAAAFLMLVGLLASYVPARRATRVDPLTALRCD
jgi:ABC-type antimicrobial peptide transport system permease subunit